VPDRVLISTTVYTLDTTRAPRPGECNGKDYHFVSRDKFRDLLAEGAFIEHAEFSGNFYGTSFEAVSHIQNLGKRCILDIEAQVRSSPLVSLFATTPFRASAK
jgi:guanylate kinase